MSRLFVVLIVFLVVIVGAIVWLAGSGTERPRTQVEKQVDLANLS